MILLLTVQTSELPTLCMDQNVSRQVALYVERFPAHVARVRVESRVEVDVF